MTAKITNLPIHEVEAIAERHGKKTAERISIANTAFHSLDCCFFVSQTQKSPDRGWGILFWLELSIAQ